ncbi:MAG: PilW family protein [Pseudomonadota bacterium]
MSRHGAKQRERGLTLVELTVSLAIGLAVVLIALTALLTGQQGYRAVDEAAQLRDRARFAADLLTRIILQAGFQDLGAEQPELLATANAFSSADSEPDLFGWNNAVFSNSAPLALSETASSLVANGNRPSKCAGQTDTSCVNGSDVLVIRFQGASAADGSADDTMINCQGISEKKSSGGASQRAANVFHISRDLSGEPSLSCSYYSFSSNSWRAMPIVESVESLQILYGTDAVTPLTAARAEVGQDGVVDRWLRADQLSVAGDPDATRENWRRVRALRVGLVLRGPAGSALAPAAMPLNPLGPLYASPSDPGSNFSVPASDSRLRLTHTFTLHLRNSLALALR